MQTEQCYGVIIVLKGENKFLLLQDSQQKDNRGFPKGHHEEGETPMETALRETKEETGIVDIKFVEAPLIREEYKIFINGEEGLKINEYFIGFVNDKNINMQEFEIGDYKWATYDEAMDTISYSGRKEVLMQAQRYLESSKE